jgi:hypothetical protein
MDARQADYPQSGLSSPYPTFPEPASEGTSADQASAAQYPPQGPDPRSSNLTPSSDYSLNPSSARSGSFPEYIQRSYQPGAQGQAPGGMAQQQSPSMSIPDGQANGHQSPQHLKSDSDVPIDPSIAAQTSPTYASHQQQYSPYTPHHDMQHYPGQHPQTPMGYPSRPEWAGQYPQPGMHYGHPATSGPPAPAMVSPVQRPPTVSDQLIYTVVSLQRVIYASYLAFHCLLLFSLVPTLTFVQGGHPLSTVYSFVPIPGAQQHKRPRRRYEEIERMYKCGWNGCEKAYGTLNHLNAHVTMQSHGAKRTPEGVCFLHFYGFGDVNQCCSGGPCRTSALGRPLGSCWCCAILVVSPPPWVASDDGS